MFPRTPTLSGDERGMMGGNFPGPDIIPQFLFYVLINCRWIALRMRVELLELGGKISDNIQSPDTFHTSAYFLNFTNKKLHINYKICALHFEFRAKNRMRVSMNILQRTETGVACAVLLQCCGTNSTQNGLTALQGCRTYVSSTPPEL